jgi:PAS domain S-box-containing protein
MSPLLFAAVFIALSPGFKSNPTIHWLVQFLSGVLLGICAVVILRSTSQPKNNPRTVLGAGLLCVAVLDMCYGVAVIPGVLANSLEELVPWGWLPSRILVPIIVLLGLSVWLIEQRRAELGKGIILAVCSVGWVVIGACCYFVLFLDSQWPQAYFLEQTLHRPYELIPAALFAIAFIGIWLVGEWRRNIIVYCILLALAISVCTHTLFMPFASKNFDNVFAAAVLTKVISYAFILVGIMLQVREEMQQVAEGERIRQRAIVDTASDGIITFGPIGTIETFNPAAEKLFGYTVEEMIGQSVNLLGVADFKSEHAEYLEQACKTQATGSSSFSTESVARRKDGTTFQVECAISEIEICDAKLFTAIVRDITERKLRQDELEEMSQRLAMALESARLGSWEHVLEDNTTRWDKQMYNLYGLGESEPVNFEIWLELLHPEDREACLLAMRQTVETGRPIDIEFRVIWKDGSVRWYKSDGKLVIGDAGQPLKVVGINRDITARKLYEEELERARIAADEASQAKSAFLASMSHEIRTPLNGVIGMAEVLYNTDLQTYQAEMTEVIRQSAFSLMAIIDDILDFSKIEAGRLEIDPTRISVTRVMEDVCATQKGYAGEKNVELTIFSDPKIPDLLMGDDVRLRQVLSNLINNAIKFSSRQERAGEVSVRAELAETQDEVVIIEFTIVDDGIGMDADTQEQLFSAFTQADASTSRRFGGTGLGLAISQRLADLMEGEIAVESQLGQGATFTARLPFGLPMENPESTQLGIGISNLRCVVVGSSEQIADDLAVYLTHAGAIVEYAPSLSAAQALNAPENSVWIVDTRSQEVLSENLDGILKLHPQAAVICRDSGRRRELESVGVISIDGNALSRKAFLQAVADASKKSDLRESPGELMEFEKLTAPTREEALERNQLTLVVEDNETNQKVIQSQLAMLGYRADIANNGTEALEYWRTGEYAFIFTDLEMPEMDGLDLVKAIRAEEQESERIPIAALTANILSREAEQCKAVGMDEYLSKPASLEDMRSVLDVWLPLENSAEEPAVDRVVGDQALVNDYLRDFPREAAPIAEELRSACRAGDFERAAAAAHKMRSSAMTVGALGLGAVCSSLEQAGRAGSMEVMSDLVTHFDTELVAVNDYIGLLVPASY